MWPRKKSKANNSSHYITAATPRAANALRSHPFFSIRSLYLEEDIDSDDHEGIGKVDGCCCRQAAGDREVHRGKNHHAGNVNSDDQLIFIRASDIISGLSHLFRSIIFLALSCLRKLNLSCRSIHFSSMLNIREITDSTSSISIIFNTVMVASTLVLGNVTLFLS